MTVQYKGNSIPAGTDSSGVSIDEFYHHESVGVEEINHRFGFHKAAIENPVVSSETHAVLREMYREMAETLDGMLPPGREKALAFHDLEQASMWSHKALARQNELVVE